MVNLQDYIEESRLFQTFSIDELLFVEYHCLVEEQQSEIWAHHNYFAYGLGGEKCWKCGNQSYHVRRGDAIFVKKGGHTVYQYFDEPFRVLFVFIPDHFIQAILAKYHHIAIQQEAGRTQNNALIPLHMNEILHSFFNSLYAYFSLPQPPHKELLRLKMEELLLSIISLRDNSKLSQYFIQLGQRQKVNLAEIMHTHFQYPLSVQDYARLCARSLSSFRRDFKATFHTTPARWLMQKRLEYSHFLLEKTDKNTAEIMDESGFINRSHFVTAFRKAYGKAPHQFRLSQMK